MGEWGEVVAIGSSDETAIEMPSGPIFGARQTLIEAAVQWHAVGEVTACDIDHDGAVDLFVAGGLENAGTSRNAVLMGDGKSFELAEDQTTMRLT